MGEGKKTSQFKKKRGYVRRYEILAYIKQPLIYILISMIVVIPVMIGLMNFAVNYVHTAQKALTMDYNDIEVDNSYKKADKNNYYKSVHIGKLMGSVVCENAGLNSKVYYGMNRVSMRDGAGMDNTSALPGNGSCVYIAGYASSGFGALYHLEKGDTLTLETYWGKFRYKVTEAKVCNHVRKMEPEGESLILVTSASTDAFSVYNDESYCVAATLISEEVQ